jgi:protein involved in polysaccharide export with SLBB domain
VVENGQTVLTKISVVQVGKAVAGDRNADVRLKPGDAVGIRQLSGWQDIGASVALSGEIKYAGTYGIQDGERLSSVLKRAGGFRQDAYPAGAVLERKQVGELAEKSRQEMIRRIESTPFSLKPGMAAGAEQQNLLQSMQQQQQQVLAALRSRPAGSRLVVKISDDLSRWENTPADVELRAGDTLFIPKRPNFVLVSGQVYNSTAITYLPGKDAGWYLRQAGGATQSGNKKNIFIVRSDGSVVGNTGAWLDNTTLRTRMQPGDSIVVPEKIVGGSQLWRNLIGAAQIMSSVALTGAAAAGIF